MQKPCKTVQAVPHAKTVQNRASCSCHAKKRASCSCHAKTAQNRASCSCHAKTAQNRARNHAKTMQKPCKNHATCGAYAGVYTGQVARQGGYAGRRGNPLNIHSPRVPCYMCYMCYISQGKPLNIHSPQLLAICAICAISHKASH